MKKNLIFILISLIIIFVSCAPEEANVEIKAGVVMKSGDVKNVARQEFLITNSDVVDLWENSKREHMKDFKLIEDIVKEEMDYDSKMQDLDNKLNKYQRSLDKKAGPNSPQTTKIIDELKEHLQKSYIFGLGDRTFFRTRKDRLEKRKTKIEEINAIIFDCSNYYVSIIELYMGGSYLSKRRIDHMKKIQGMLDIIIKLADETEIERTNISKLNQEKNNLKKELQSKANEQLELLKNKAMEYFQIKIRDYIIESFTTDLNGEALLTIKKGKYFLFGITQVGQSNIIWNLPVNIEEKEHYIEISNDNAFAIDDATLASELLEALEGFKVNFSIDKEF